MKGCGLSCRSCSLAISGRPCRPSTAIFVAVGDPAGPSMAATDSLLCCKYSPSI